ncbi:hypothetical protein EZI54_14320 [Marinobacter halodurans]|uniref:DUF2780 domain-containing protein n=1 Tax=Marinobacter halodurans TaxID=2528979 RepID=A0ABY1ZI43_9GAMM|nr:DUF2780 domain-containing protein [Marinobacter halodurans]TBW54285.1 hypothetical protein EZI54_14320 [Marinobacter halodurans]
MNTILKRFLIVSSLYLLAPSVGALDLGNKLDSGGVLMPEDAVKVSGEASSLVTSLQDHLGVTRTQAAGGAGALLQLAKSQLGASSFDNITDKVSGLGSLLGGSGEQSNNLLSSALSNISSMDDVEKAFSALGLQSSAIEQFAPLVLNFLKGQGVGQEMLGNLSSLWMPESSA